MSTREKAYNILNQFSEEELERFVAYFSIIYPMSDDSAANEKQSYHEIGTVVDDMAERRAAFERMEKVCRPMPGLDEKKALAEYREEKYGK
ncbi:MAG: hypothetical protein IIY78_02815 [Clostridia bacterium]|nr:hypothetical protein [Clostridia bacterium]